MEKSIKPCDPFPFTFFKRCHPHNFKKIHVEEDFLKKDECNKLSKYILNHRLIKEVNKTDVLHGNYTFKIRFNKYSLDDFLNPKYDLYEIYKIFQKIKQPGTNAYIFNPLVVNGSDVFDTMSKNSVEYHYDDTISVKDDFGKYYLPVCTTVLYIEVPKHFLGGQIKLFDFGFTEKRNMGLISERPKMGKKIVFRGDMCHGVSKMYSDKDKCRISLVFEQYNLPEEHLSRASFGLINGGQILNI